MAGFNKNNVGLFTCSLVFLGFWTLLPANDRWLQKRVLPFYRDFSENLTKHSEEYRKQKRWGPAYVYSLKVKHLASQQSLSAKDIISIPEPSYFKRFSINYPVPEPAVFYYYTGLKTVPMSLESGAGATYRLVVHSDTLALLNLHSNTKN